MHAPDEDNEHRHADTHDHGHGADPHAPGPDDPPPSTEWQFLEQALSELLVEEGVLENFDIFQQMDFMESRNPALGAKVVARAWTDPDFHDRLVENPRGTLKDEMAIDIGTLAELEVVANTDDTHHVVVCTLCSCYPRNLLGIPPAWYKSPEYRSRVVREPRQVLAEFGTELDDKVSIRVMDSTADLRYLVIPRRTSGTEGLDADALEKLVSRDSMIGTSEARPRD
jgi:nitrile hydratase